MVKAWCLALCLCLSGCLWGCGGSGESAAEGNGFYFDTEISIQITGKDPEELLDGCFSLCGQMETVFSRTREDSELYQVNHRSEDHVLLSEDLAAVVKTGIEFYELTGGKLDITVGPLCEIWDFTGEKNEPPSQEEIREALEKVDGSSIRLEGRILYFERQDTILDLGALAKGYISDKLKEYLKAAGVESALINLGGNVMTVGSKPDGSPWTVGIQKPFAPRGTYEKTVSVEDRAVISAGTYERYYEWQGQQYHHILDPDTGYPARTEYAQATIISSSGLLGDALSTSCLLLGREGAEALTGQFPDTELIL